jgi:hypothetical protein
MSDRRFAIATATLATLAFLLFWAWHSDAWLKYQCSRVNGHWDASARVCDITAGRFRAAPASPPG